MLNEPSLSYRATPSRIELASLPREGVQKEVLDNLTIPLGVSMTEFTKLLAELGISWLLAGESPVLKVPSVIVPDEWTVVINPLHNSFEDVSIETVSTFDRDSRFWDGYYINVNSRYKKIPSV